MPLSLPDKMLFLTEINRATAAGTSLRAACAAAGVPIASVTLWRNTLETRGTLADARRDRSGRKPAVNLTPAEEQALRQLVFKKRMSEDSAIRALIKHPACSPATRTFIERRIAAGNAPHRTKAKKPRWPDSLRRAAHITEGEKERFYGPDATRSNEIITQRRLTWELNGREIPLRPHTIWQFDDYSTNKPYWLEYAAGKFRVCRQILAGMDTFTQGWLGFYHVGKERDAYTGGDALRTVLLCMDAHGTMPQAIIFEQGRWKGNALRGIPIRGSKDSAGASPHRRWGGISEAGIIVEYTHDSRGKAEIEGGFHPLQIELDGGADIGHTRGLHERESDNYLAVNKGSRDPRLCGFTSLDSSEESHYQAAALLNARRKERSAPIAAGTHETLGFASADELFAEFPVEQRPLPVEHRWIFEFPHKQEAVVGSISRSLVGCTVNERKFFFVVNGIRENVYFDDGHRVLIAFDPERPHMGCVVANADDSTKNRDNWRLGEMLLGGAFPVAQQWDSVPRLSVCTPDGLAAGDFDAPDTSHWKQRKGAVRASQAGFQAILPGGKRGLRVMSKRTRNASAPISDHVNAGHSDPDTAAMLATRLRGGEESGVAQPVPAPGCTDRASNRTDAAPRPTGTGLPAVAGETPRFDAGTAPPRLRTHPDAIPDDDDTDAVEAAAMRRAGVLSAF